MECCSRWITATLKRITDYQQPSARNRLQAVNGVTGEQAVLEASEGSSLKVKNEMERIRDALPSLRWKLCMSFED